MSNHDESPAARPQASAARPLPSAARPLVAFAFGAAIAAAILVGSSHGDLDKTAFGDGVIVRSVAARIGAAPQDVNRVVVSRGTSLRYGRIGMPGVVWLLAGGRPGGVRYTPPLVVVLATGATTAAAGAS